MLLQEIIDLAVDNKQSVSALLRKCLVLSHQLRNDRLKGWANQELNGYLLEDTLPSYRIIGAQAKGHLSGWGGSAMNNWPIPPALLEEEHQRYAEKVYLTQAIRAYEDLLSTPKQGRITTSWPTNLVLYYQDKLDNSKDMALVAAWQEIPRSAVVGIVDTIRTRTLNMALELKDELGESDNDLKAMTAEEATMIEKSVVTNIYGGNNFFAAGQSSINANANQQTIINAGNREELNAALLRSGLAPLDLENLTKAIDADGDQNIGARVKDWIQKAAPKVIAGGIKIGVAVGQPVLEAYLKQYFGIC